MKIAPEVFDLVPELFDKTKNYSLVFSKARDQYHKNKDFYYGQLYSLPAESMSIKDNHVVIITRPVVFKTKKYINKPGRYQIGIPINMTLNGQVRFSIQPLSENFRRVLLCLGAFSFRDIYIRTPHSAIHQCEINTYDDFVRTFDLNVYVEPCLETFASVLFSSNGDLLAFTRLLLLYVNEINTKSILDWPEKQVAFRSISRNYTEPHKEPCRPQLYEVAKNEFLNIDWEEL